MNTLLAIALAMAVGLALTRLAKLAGIPNVTAYLVAGIAVRYFMKLINCTSFEGLDVVTSVALGFIAFSIGSSFKLKHIRHIGKSVVVITLFQALTTVLLVDAALLILHFGFNKISISEALCLGAIATATAPAATLMVVRQYKARGIVTDTLLPVVAFDDAIGLIIFAISLAVAKALAVANASVTIMEVLVVPLLEIVISLGFGGILGVLLAYAAKVFKSRANRISLCVVAVFAGVGLCTVIPNFALSDLLTCMAIGIMYANLNKESGQIFDIMDRWTSPLFLLFFIISGAELDLTLIPMVGLIGIVYLISRSIGKYSGAYLGAKIVHADDNVKKYLGLTLLPQAGVAIGMAQKVANTPELISAGFASSVVTVTLCATLVYELLGPLVAKWALVKSGEIIQEKPISSKQKASA